jgi:sugar/nucleoside kinase (ribokinase family)
LFVTLGRSGVVFTNGSEIEMHPAYKTDVVDTIGAGDGFFAFASLMSHLNWEPHLRLAIPSLAASLTTTWLANEHHITKSRLIDHAEKNL